MAERTIDRLRAAVGRLLGGTGGRRSAPSSPRPSAPPGRPASDGGSPPPDGQRRYPGDFRGIPAVAYAPKPDGQPDPGEIVWTWVAFEEDSRVGKDRPVAVVGRTDDHRLVVLMLSSRDHTGNRDWISIGTGRWDREGRQSWVRRDRILAVAPSAVRREGAILPRDRYDDVIRGLGGTASPPPKRTPILARLRGLLRRTPRK